MNYQHAFHAGNFADCFKHVLLVTLLEALARKASPFFVLDTHAGAGYYNLESEAARRTGEADRGIRQLLISRPAGLQRFVSLVEQVGLYPGSPAFARALLRETDQLVCCELQAATAQCLRSWFRRDPRVHVHQRSGWEAIGALLPPAERRGLVFVDPPFEQAGDFNELANAIVLAHKRFRNGVFAGWYPLTRPATVRSFYNEVSGRGISDIIAIEFRISETLAPGHFSGCGMIVMNPPYLFAEEARVLSEAVLVGLGTLQAGAGIDVIRLANE